MWIPLSRYVFLPLHEFAMRRPTFRYYSKLLETQFWPRTEIHKLQLEKLDHLVSIALTKTTGYAAIAGCSQSWRPRAITDLNRLPLIDKTVIAANREALSNKEVAGGMQRSSTGGSTGDPLIFFLDKRRQAYDKAARMRSHQWFGILPGDREAYIWGSPIELKAQDRIKQIREYFINDRLWSAFELSAASVGRFIEGLYRFRPRCVFGYPSTLAVFCQLAAEKGYDLAGLKVKVVFCTAEVLYQSQRDLISQAFGSVPVVDGYGSREGGFISHECPTGKYHITDENLIVEFLRDGHPVGPGEDGEIVITHLDNYAMPFIRYRTGDIGQWSDEACSCGRTLSIMKVLQGRSEDFLLTPDGRWLSGPALSYLFREIPGVSRYQILQDDVIELKVRIITGPNFPEDGEEQIAKRVHMFLGSSIRVHVEQVSDIPPEPSGKSRCILSKIARSRQALFCLPKL